VSNNIAPASPEPWVRWAQLRAGLAVRASDYSVASTYFRSARDCVSFSRHEDLWLDLAGKEIGCLERASDYHSLLAAIESVAPFLPLGSYCLYRAWAGRIRHKLGLLEWDSEVVGRFLEVDRDLSGMHSVIYGFVTSAGDTLSLNLGPGTVFRHGRDVWTPGGLGFVFDVDDAPVFEGSRHIDFEMEGRSAQVFLSGRSFVVLAEFSE
jgi:hypothetical protein